MSPTGESTWGTFLADVWHCPDALSCPDPNSTPPEIADIPPTPPLDSFTQTRVRIP